MTPIQQLMLGVGAKKKTYMDDVFSTYVYAGNQTARSINNGIDLSGEGGLVWTKARNIAWQPHLVDTVRGADSRLYTSGNAAASSYNNLGVTSFNSNGYSLGADGTSGMVNYNSKTYASWTFRKAPGFFDIVTWTGNSDTNQTISHSLSSVPGLIIAKRTDSSTTGDWVVYHRDHEGYLKLNSNTSAVPDSGAWTPVTSTSFKAYDYINVNGASYVAYVFAGGESTAATARSVDFDGNDSLTLAASNDFHCTGDLTIEGWFNPDTLDDFLFCLGDKGGAYGVTVYLDGSQLKMNHSGALKMTVSGTPVPIGQWTHVALERSGSTVRLYVNGISRATYQENNDFGGASDSQKTFTVGSGLSSGSATEQFDGKISNFRFVKGTAVYTSSFRPPTEPLTNITNTKLLCCNNSSTTGSTVTPGTITAGGNPTASTDSPFDDPAGFAFGDSGKENVIKCGSYIGNGSDTGPEINLGLEPQWLLIKDATSSGDGWEMFDSMRGIVSDGSDQVLNANENDDESSGGYLDLTSTGFKFTTSSTRVNKSGDNYIYMAIRRPDGYVGKPAKVGTDVFAMDTGDGNSTMPTFDSNFPVDFALNKAPGSVDNIRVTARLMSGKYMRTNTDVEQLNYSGYTFDGNVGWAKTDAASTTQSWMWKRHAGFDVVTYTGNGTAGHQIPHSLSKSAEMIWVKKRSATEQWMVGHKGLDGGVNPWGEQISLNLSNDEVDSVNFWYDTAPTATHFTLGSGNYGNTNNATFIAMLFASVDGISKVGYYTGNGTSGHSITTGFQPRFVIIKCTTQTAGWYVLDTLRGWGSGNDEYLSLNSTSAQDGQNDFGAPTSTGFTLNLTGNAANGDGEKYIYYAHA